MKAELLYNEPDFAQYHQIGINDSIYIKLTEAGYTHFMNKVPGLTIEKIKQSETDTGLLPIQLWNYIWIFGEEIKPCTLIQFTEPYILALIDTL